MPSEPRWLTADEIIRFNHREVARTGEPHFLSNPNGLDIAVASPQHHYAYGEIDIVNLAVGFLFSIARNHPFEQGNKRTAFIAAIIFLELNGIRLDIPNSDEFAEYIKDVINRQRTESQFRQLVLPYITHIP